MKNQIFLDNYCFDSELKAEIRQLVDYYNDERYHESSNNLTSADVLYVRGAENPRKTRRNQA